MLATIWQFGIGLCATAAGRKLVMAAGGVLIVWLAYGAGDWHGRSVANKAAEIANLQAKLKTTETDLQVQKKTAAAVQAERGILAQQAAELADKVSTYEAEIRARNSTACPLSDDDVSRLRQLGERAGSSKPSR